MLRHLKKHYRILLEEYLDEASGFKEDTQTQEQDPTEVHMYTEVSFLQEPEEVTHMRRRRKRNFENLGDAVKVVNEDGEKEEEEEYSLFLSTSLRRRNSITKKMVFYWNSLLSMNINI